MSEDIRDFAHERLRAHFDSVLYEYDVAVGVASAGIVDDLVRAVELADWAPKPDTA